MLKLLSMCSSDTWRILTSGKHEFKDGLEVVTQGDPEMGSVGTA